ncbi:hypothetical protein NPIL_170981 [Nephila pilipes]|uniref:Uncharacterized protein n=1 Tax=Nephila pilipes TaxID=299642 RepID=A0A8X6TV33_NEPPI|nr:hypothetical protein NPIL_170981 [Nephila pilipes]
MEILKRSCDLHSFLGSVTVTLNKCVHTTPRRLMERVRRGTDLIQEQNEELPSASGRKSKEERKKKPFSVQGCMKLGITGNLFNFSTMKRNVTHSDHE